MGGRAVDCSGLLNRRGTLSAPKGSNPFPSAKNLRKGLALERRIAYILLVSSREEHKMTMKELIARLNKNVTVFTMNGETAKRDAAIAVLDVLVKMNAAKMKGDIGPLTKPEAETEEDDPMDDYNYVGSRHHY